MHMLIRAVRLQVSRRSLAQREISRDNVSHQPSVRYFQLSLLFHSRPPPRPPVPKDPPAEKTDTSRSKVRILFPGTRHPSPGPPRVVSLFVLFFCSFLPPFRCPIPLRSRDETESRVKTAKRGRAKPRVDSLCMSIASARARASGRLAPAPESGNAIFLRRDGTHARLSGD